MSDAPRRSIESLKKEAKRWLRELEADDPAALARLDRAFPDAPATPTLRDIQHAIAREQGHAGWAELKADFESRAAGGTERITLAAYDEKADALLEAYRTGTPEAMERHWRHTWHHRAWVGMRTYVQLDLGRRPAEPGGDVPITLDDARRLVAVEHGFESWSALAAYVLSAPPRAAIAAAPVRALLTGSRAEPMTIDRSREWHAIVGLLRESAADGLDAEGQMTDAVMRDVCSASGITTLRLGGSKALTDDGMRHLANLPRLSYLDLSGTAVTDRGLEVLRRLPALEHLSLGGTRVTDAGIAALDHCDELRHLDLAWTATGDGAIGALAGKAKLAHLRTGNGVTNAGLARLADLPVFRSWQRGEVTMELTGYDAGPNYLLLRGPFTDRGMQALRKLEGLFALNIDGRSLPITPAGLAPLADLPNLGWLAVHAVDASMPYIAAMPRLRFLACQDTPAGDDGFAALARSQSIEYIWGRDSHNLRRRGFLALAGMPALRSFALSCLNVDDEGLAELPRFPSLTELMPMGVADEGYRHIGRCERLESLVLMYCRDTTDAATERITALPKLRRYFASYTLATDRTPALLAGMDSLERVTFDGCAGVTDAGIARLARLPRLREVRATGPGVTPALAGAFAVGVEVSLGPG